jgi:hypothetical protein
MRLFLATIALAAGLGSSMLHADTLGLDVTGAVPDYGSSVWNLGWEFTVNSPTSITGLGNFDFGSTANLPQPQQVGLWNSSGQLLASTYVDSSSIQLGNWAFTLISPVALTVGDTYIVGGEGGADYTGIAPVTVAPQISFVEDLYTYLGSGTNTPLVEPIDTEGYTSTSDAGWFGGNVLLGTTATPEPGYYVLLSGGLLALWAARRRKATQA